VKVDGRCYCGHITYVAEIDPNRVEICHCTDCQAFSSSAFRIVVPAEPGTFQLLTGEPTKFVKTAESGTKRVQAFCPTCGTPIYSGPADESASEPAFLGLRVGSLLQRDQLPPKEQYWTRSRRHWLDDLDRLRTFKTE
jgi:hypothetical protein